MLTTHKHKHTQGQHICTQLYLHADFGFSREAKNKLYNGDALDAQGITSC